jgi:hypothetical protein
MNDIPLERIDNTSFMIGKTGTCYFRKTAAWKGMLVLSLARGGLMNTYYGNLELIDNKNATWFAKAQSLFFSFQRFGRIATFGGIPGQSEPYGYTAVNQSGALFTVINPSQKTEKVKLPLVSSFQKKPGKGRILFTDDGFTPILDGNQLTLGSEQLCLVGYGEFNSKKFDLGIGSDVVIPDSIEKLKVSFKETGKNRILARFTPPKNSDLRIVWRQSINKIAHHTTGGAPPAGKNMKELFRIKASADGKEVPVEIRYGKQIWSGLSWAAGEIRKINLAGKKQITISCESEEEKKVEMKGDVYKVKY